MKHTRLTETNLFGELDEEGAWLAERGVTQRNRLRIYRENLITMREREKTISVADLFAAMQKAFHPWPEQRLAAFI